MVELTSLTYFCHCGNLREPGVPCCDDCERLYCQYDSNSHRCPNKLLNNCTNCKTKARAEGEIFCPDCLKGNGPFEIEHPDYNNKNDHNDKYCESIKKNLNAEQYKGWLLGMAMQYLLNYIKNNHVEDLKKSREFLDKLIDLN